MKYYFVVRLSALILPAVVVAEETYERFSSYLLVKATGISSHKKNYLGLEGGRKSPVTVGGTTLSDINGIWYLVAPDPRIGGPIRLITEEQVDSFGTYSRSRPHGSQGGNASPLFAPGIPNDELFDRLKWWYCEPSKYLPSACQIAFQKPRMWTQRIETISGEEFLQAGLRNKGHIPGRLGKSDWKAIWELNEGLWPTPALRMSEPVGDGLKVVHMAPVSDVKAEPGVEAPRDMQFELTPAQDMEKMSVRFQNPDRVSITEQVAREKLLTKAEIWHAKSYNMGDFELFACPHDTSYYLVMAYPDGEYEAAGVSHCVKLESMSFAYRFEKPRMPMPTEAQLAEWEKNSRSYSEWRKRRRGRPYAANAQGPSQGEENLYIKIEEDLEDGNGDDLLIASEHPEKVDGREVDENTKVESDNLQVGSGSEVGDLNIANERGFARAVQLKVDTQPGWLPPIVHEAPQADEDEVWERFSNPNSPEVPEPKHLRKVQKKKKFKSDKNEYTNMYAPPKRRGARPQNGGWVGNEDRIKKQIQMHTQEKWDELERYMHHQEDNPPEVVETVPLNYPPPVVDQPVVNQPVVNQPLRIPPFVEEQLHIPPLRQDVEDLQAQYGQFGVLDVVNTALGNMDLSHLTQNVGLGLIGIARELRAAQERIRDAMEYLMYQIEQNGAGANGE